MNESRAPSMLHTRGKLVERGPGIGSRHRAAKKETRRGNAPAPGIIRVRCCGKLHRVAWWTGGRITLVDHTAKDRLAFRTIKDLGGEECECQKTQKKLAKMCRVGVHAKLREQVTACRDILRSRHRTRREAGGGDQLQQAADGERRQPGVMMKRRADAKSQTMARFQQADATAMSDIAQKMWDVDDRPKGSLGMGGVRLSAGMPAAWVAASSLTDTYSRGWWVLKVAARLDWKRRVLSRGWAVLPNEMLAIDAEQDTGASAIVTAVQVLMLHQTHLSVPVAIVRRLLVEKDEGARVVRNELGVTAPPLRVLGVVGDDGTLDTRVPAHRAPLSATPLAK